MPLETLAVVAAISAVFVAFAAVLIFADLTWNRDETPAEHR